MSTKDTQNEQGETISDLSLKLKQQKNQRNQKIRVRLTKPLKRPTYFTAHFLVFLVLLLSLIGTLTYLSNRGENTELLATTKSLVSEQKNYEKDFTSAGHTIKNPRIILNPYQNSPLTALIIFETDDEVSPTVTIPGKDAKTTLSHQFVKSKKHFLPIYGLYPNSVNKIKITYETSAKTESSQNDQSIARSGNVVSQDSPAKKLEQYESESPLPTPNIKDSPEYQDFLRKIDSTKNPSDYQKDREGYGQFAPINQTLNNQLESEDSTTNSGIVATIEREFKIKTDALPDNIPAATVTKADKSALDSSLYFYSPATKNNSMVAYDLNGDIRWYLKDTAALWENAKLSNGHLLVSTERLINPPYYMTGLYEIDLLGKIYAEYSLPGGYHHDYFELQNGNLLVASNNFTKQNNTVEDYVVELDRKTGQIIKKVDLKQILKTEDGKSENWSSYDWFHNNSIYFDQSSNSLILSGRHQDAVVSLNYQTSEINWILGDPTNWSEEYQKYFLKPVGSNFEYQWSQHAAKITPEGYLFLFDNGNNKSKNPKNYVSANHSYSRGVLYEINNETKTVRQLWQYGKERGSNFYSPYISDVDYLGQNHYLIHSGGIVKANGEPSNQPAGLTNGNLSLLSDTVEILNNKIIFELKSSTNNYRVEKMDVYAGVNYSLTSAKRLGSLGKTEVDDAKQGFITDSNIDQSFLDTHKIMIKNEEDRITVSGFFKREDQVRIGLYRNFNTNFYNLRVSKKPYTALCVDIFTEEENQNGIQVTKYINKEGLRGNYSLYTEYNGKLYNTGKYVNTN